MKTHRRFLFGWVMRVMFGIVFSVLSTLTIVSGSAVMMLIVSLALSAPPGTRANARQLASSKASAELLRSAIQSPGRLVPRRMLPTSSIAQEAAVDTSDDLSIDASFGDENIVFERKKHRRQGCICHVIVISIIGVLVGKPAGEQGPPMIDLRATITGDDAVRGSVLFGLAWLAGDSDPAGSVRTLGYDIEVSKQHDRPCTEGTPSPVCVERARRLATLVDATLALGETDERALFQKGAAALGIAPDCSAASTTMSTASLAASLDTVEDMLIDASIGDRQIVLSRKKKGAQQQGEYMDIRYDIDVSTKNVHSCSNPRVGFTCENEAHRLATLLDTTLALGRAEDRAQFRQDAAAIGIAPDCSLRVP